MAERTVKITETVLRDSHQSLIATRMTTDEILSLIHIWDFKLLFYNIKAVTGGTDALGEVRVRITDADGREYPGKGVSTDIIKSSIRAYINAINRSMIREP